MPRNDTWRGRDAHQGLAEGLGPWRVGRFLYKVQLDLIEKQPWNGRRLATARRVARSGSAGVALAVGRGLAAVRLLDPLFQRRASLFQPSMPQTLEEPVQEDWGLPFSSPLMFAPTHETNPATASLARFPSTFNPPSEKSLGRLYGQDVPHARGKASALTALSGLANMAVGVGRLGNPPLSSADQTHRNPIVLWTAWARLGADSEIPRHNDTFAAPQRE